MPVFLACLAGVFAGNACYCWRLGCRDEEKEVRVGEGDQERGETAAGVLLH